MFYKKRNYYLQKHYSQRYAEVKGNFTVEAVFVLLLALTVFLAVIVWGCYLRDMVYLQAVAQKRANSLSEAAVQDVAEGKMDWYAWSRRDLFWRALSTLGKEDWLLQAEKDIVDSVGEGMIFPQTVQGNISVKKDLVSVTYQCEYHFPLVGLLAPFLGHAYMEVKVTAVAKCTEQEELLRLIQGIFHAVEEKE